MFGKAPQTSYLILELVGDHDDILRNFVITGSFSNPYLQKKKEKYVQIDLMSMDIKHKAQPVRC